MSDPLRDDETPAEAMPPAAHRDPVLSQSPADLMHAGVVVEVTSAEAARLGAARGVEGSVGSEVGALAALMREPPA